MHAPASQALRAVVSRYRSTTSRFPTVRPYPSPRRGFRISYGRLRENDPSGNPELPEAVFNHVSEEPLIVPDEDATPNEQGEVMGNTGGPSSTPPNNRDRSGYGSASRRASRNIRRKEVSPPQLPQWFLDRNVLLWEVGSQTANGVPLHNSSFTDTSGSPDAGPSPHSQSASENVVTPISIQTESPKSHAPSDQQPTEPIYTVDEHVLKEIDATISAGLRVPHDANAASARSHVVLHCPQEGGTYFLESLVNHVAASFDADVIRLDPQDIAEIGGNYMPEFKDPRGNTLSALGYESYLATTMREAQESEDPDEEEDDGNSEEEEVSRRPKSLTAFQRPSVGIVPIAQFTGSFGDILKGLSSFRGALNADSSQPSGRGMPTSIAAKTLEPPDMTINIKTNMLVETLLNASDVKRAAETKGSSSQSSSEDSGVATHSSAVSEGIQGEQPVFVPTSELGYPPKNIIVLIRDYPEISLTQNGNRILDQLHEAVQRRRQDGQRIVIVGTTSAKDLIPSFSKSGIRHIQSEHGNGSMRTIVTPSIAISGGATLAQQARARMQDINIRHLQDMLRRTTPKPAQVHTISTSTDLQDQIDSGILFASGFDETVWSMDRVHRTATLALGLLKDGREMTVQDIEQALTIIDASDNSKFTWVEKEKEQEKKKADPLRRDSSSPAEIEERMKKLRKTCNAHEKKLLHGVIDPANIRTTFTDVRAAPETIEALKTLTSLSLVRPDAFTYGVLATDHIPGLLLYGPPGTGKTLLAKAVAKESGATVLEVSGSDVYDMYVGEGEKNIRAIFTLAKKLSPCIVFIDEADAILGSRGGSSNRTTHRELINQFLREWDGMTSDMSAFIMVATNRPFDLDEASLRRLPRRLLVDLPTEKDREAILAIHLKDELLHPNISLSALASQTPFYSGSDLKNLCVAAALACVREEFDTAAAAQAKGDDAAAAEVGYQYPEKRTLEQRHFNRAMEEISASISEDMGSLRAIRKFDEKYGDRRGRRKKMGGGYGFGTVKENERNVDGSARVRNQS